MKFTIPLIIFFAQMLSSCVRSLSVNAVVKSSAIKAIAITAIGDVLFFTVTAGVTSQVLKGDFSAVAIAVIGGVIGNYLAIKFLRK
jgi:hypothetical protein